MAPALERYRFGDTEVDTARFIVRRRGDVVPLEPKAFDVLVYLLERRERVVEKDELLEALWPTFVSESVLPRSVVKIRKALGDDGELVQTVRGRGYRFVGDAVVAVPAAVSQPVRRSLPPDDGGWASEDTPSYDPSPRTLQAVDGAFVGRERLMESLAGWLATGLAGAGGVLMITAPAGLGKTRTASELSTLAAKQEARVMSGRCRQGTAPAFWPWLQLLRGAAPDQVAASGLSSFIGELARATEPSPEDRFVVFDRVFAMLTEGGQPTCAILDDMQWADEGSRRLFEFVLDQLEGTPFVLVATARSDGSSEMLETIELVRRQRHGLVVELDELTREDVGRLVAEALGDADPETVGRLHERTGGNPFFVVELLRATLLSGRTDVSGSLPGTIKAAVELAVGDVDGAERRLLETLALCDHSVSLGLLAEVVDRPRDQVATSLQAMVRRGVAVGEGERVTLRHDLIREAIASSIALDDRRELHMAIAQALRSRGPLARVAHHLFLAGPDAAGEARTVAERAAEHALSEMAYEQAAELLELALSAIGSSPSDPEVSASERAELLLARAEALRLGGKEQDARACSIEAAELARQEGSYDLLARAALALGTDVERERIGDDEQRRLLEQARDGLDQSQEPGLSALLLGRLANLPPHVDDVQRRQSLSAEAVALARRANNPRVLAQALRAHLVALWGPDGLDERVVVAEELVGLAERGGMLDERATARDAMALVSLARGDQLAARHQLSELEKITSALARPGRQFRLHWLHTSAAITEGRFDDAERHLGEAKRLAFELGDPFAQLLTILLGASLDYDRGRWDGVAVVPEALATVYPWAGRIRIALGADVLWRKGKQDEARQMVASMSLRELSAIPKDEHWFVVMALLSMAATRLGDRERAARLLELLEPYADRHVFNDMMGTGRGPARFYLGVLARGLERYEEGLEHLRAARQHNLRAGIEPGLVRCDVQTAKILLARDAPGDREDARRLHADAIEKARRLDLGSQVSLLEAMADRLS